MDEKIYKITSIDIGSTNSQMAQTYGTSTDDGKTWKGLNAPSTEVQYLLRDNGLINIPTILLRKSDLTESQKMVIGELKKDYLAGHEANELFRQHYGLKLISEFKKNFFCSEEAKDNEEAKERYEAARSAILQFLTFLKQRESMEAQKYTDAVEKTILTLPVRSTATERETMRQLAETAGWKNIEIQDEARSVLRYALSKKNSLLVSKLSQMTLLQDFYVLIMDIGGSTTDLLLVKIRPDGNGGFSDPDIVAQWPEIGETDTLGCIDIDKRLCNWFLDNGFILQGLTEEAIRMHGYSFFREFKENNMAAIKNGLEISQLTGSIVNLEMSTKDRQFSRVNYSQSPLKMNQFVFLYEIAWEYLGRIQNAVRKLLKDAGVSERDLDCIVMAGGGTKLYGIQEMLLGKLGLPDPLQFSKIQKEPRMLIESSEEPSAVCALGNVMPLPHISFKNHAFSDFIMKVKIFNVPVNQKSGWDLAHMDRPEIPSDFKRVFFKYYKIMEQGTVLPQTKDIEESFIVESGAKTAYVYVIEIFSSKDGKQHFQRAWSSYSMRTPVIVLGDWLRRDNSGHLNGQYSIQVTFGEDYTISITPKIKIDGNWGFSSSTRKLNG